MAPLEKFSTEQAGTLRSAVFRLHRRLRNETSTHSHLTGSQELVLDQLLHHPRQTGAELARHQNITPQSMTKIIATLLDYGYIARGTNPQDKRRKEHYLTPAGKTAITGILNCRNQWLQDRTAEALTPAEAQQLAAALPLLHKLSYREPKTNHPGEQ